MTARADYAKSSSRAPLTEYVEALVKQTREDGAVRPPIFLIVRMFVELAAGNGEMFVFALPRHLANYHARALRSALTSDGDPDGPEAKRMVLPTHFMRTYVCSRCRRFCGHLSDTRAANPMTAYGAVRVRIEPATEDARMVRKLREACTSGDWSRVAPRFDQTAPAPGGLVQMWRERIHRSGAVARIDADRIWVPKEPYNAAMEALRDDGTEEYAQRDDVEGDAEVDRWRAGIEEATAVVESRKRRVEESKPTWQGALDAIARVASNAEFEPPPNEGRAPYEPAFPQELPVWGDENLDAEERIMRRWRKLVGPLAAVGFRSDTSQEEREAEFSWVCALKRGRNETRRAKQARSTRSKVEPSLPPRQLASSRRAVENKLRRDARIEAEHAACSTTRLLEVNLMGSALRLDGEIYMACCSCLHFMRLSEGRWDGDAIVCGGCVDAANTARSSSSSSSTSSGVSNVVRLAAVAGRAPAVAAQTCFHPRCGRQAAADERFATLVVFADVQVGGERFVDIHFCDKHVKDVAWVHALPTIQTQSAVYVALVSNVKTARRYSPTTNYLSAFIYGDRQSGTAAASHSASMLLPGARRTRPTTAAIARAEARMRIRTAAEQGLTASERAALAIANAPSASEIAEAAAARRRRAISNTTARVSRRITTL